MFIVGPVLAFVVTRRICIGLQRRDAGLVTHGVETGIIRQLPNGEFVEEHRPLTEEERAPLAGKPSVQPLPAPGSGSGSASDANGVPAPHMSGLTGRARAIANRAFAETVPLQSNGHGPRSANGSGSTGPGNGSGNGSGHGEGRAPGERAAVEAGPDGREPPPTISPGSTPSPGG